MLVPPPTDTAPPTLTDGLPLLELGGGGRLGLGLAGGEELLGL